MWVCKCVWRLFPNSTVWVVCWVALLSRLFLNLKEWKPLGSRHTSSFSWKELWTDKGRLERAQGGHDGHIGSTHSQRAGLRLCVRCTGEPVNNADSRGPPQTHRMEISGGRAWGSAFSSTLCSILVHWGLRTTAVDASASLLCCFSEQDSEIAIIFENVKVL